MLVLEGKITLSAGVEKAKNLCSRFGELDIKSIGGHVFDGYRRDLNSREAWAMRMNAAMDLAMQVQNAKTFPWPGAANVVFPLVTIAALQFSSKAYPNIIQGNNVVRYRTIGATDQPGLERANRIGRHMSWQCLEQDESWEEQYDRLLINLAIVGVAFIKSRFDPRLGYPVDELVMARDLVVNYWAKSIETAERKTHVLTMSRNDIYERCMAKTFVDVTDEAWFKAVPTTQSLNVHADKRSGIQPGQQDETTAYRILEQHCQLDLDGDGYDEPYIVTIEENSKTVLRIVARWERDRDIKRTTDGKIMQIQATEYFTKFSFIPSPDGSIYDIGFGTFLGPINEAVSTGINQLLDNGTMQNSLGGFLGRGVKIRGGVYTMAPFEWKRVDSTGDDLRKNLVQFPERSPSVVMFQLISLLIDYSNRIAGTVDATVGENPGQNTPASTYQGMTEQGMQTYQMIFKRVWRAMRLTFKKRYQINRVFTPTRMKFGPNDDLIRQEDYNGNPDQIAPVANPKLTSSMMRIQQAMAVKQDSMVTQGYDVEAVTRAYLEALDVEAVTTLYPGPGKVPPLPNPKMAVEQMKMEGKKLELEAEKQKWAMHLMEERRLNGAKIKHLEAASYKLMKEAGVVDPAHQLNAFETAINALKTHNDMINDRIEALKPDGESDDASPKASKPGGVPLLGGPSGDSGSQGVSPDSSGVH